MYESTAGTFYTNFGACRQRFAKKGTLVFTCGAPNHQSTIHAHPRALRTRLKVPPASNLSLPMLSLPESLIVLYLRDTRIAATAERLVFHLQCFSYADSPGLVTLLIRRMAIFCCAEQPCCHAIAHHANTTHKSIHALCILF